MKWLFGNKWLFSVAVCVCVWGGNRQAYILPNNSSPPLVAVGGGGGSRPFQPMNSLVLLSGRGGALPRLYRAEMSNKRGLGR